MPSTHSAHGRIVHHVTNKETTVYECLAQHFRLDKNRVDELFSLGAVYSNKLRITEDRKLSSGAYLRIHLKPKRFEVSPVNWKERIVFECSDFIVVNKPAGIPVHATVDNWNENILTQFRKATQKNLLITQRLDIPVTGLLTFAKNIDFQRKFNRWLGENKIQKKYTALCEGVVEPGRKVHFMQSTSFSPKVLVDETTPGAQRCELTVLSCTALSKNISRIEIQLHTGRTHQIRVQMSGLGNPILGDSLYGSKVPFEANAIALCATELAWVDKMPRLFILNSPF